MFFEDDDELGERTCGECENQAVSAVERRSEEFILETRAVRFHDRQNPGKGLTGKSLLNFAIYHLNLMVVVCPALA